MSRIPTMVFAGEFWDGASGAGLAAGFRQAGWAVQEVERNHFAFPKLKNIVGRLASRLLRKEATRAYREALVRACAELNPDIFLTIKGTDLDLETLHRIRAMGIPMVMFYPDYHFGYAQVTVDTFAQYDLFITTKSFQMDHLSEMLGPERVALVPHGYVDGTHAPVFDNREEAETFDVLYAGNHSPSKQDWLEALARSVPEASIALVGNRWEQAGRSGPLKRATLLGEKLAVGYAQAIQSGKINIALHMGAAANGWADLVSTRTFEIPACKGFMLHIDNAEVHEFFEAGSEIDTFATADELCDKVRHYLDRPDLRAAMIERAFARCVPAYGYAARARQIAELLRSRLSVGPARDIVRLNRTVV